MESEGVSRQLVTMQRSAPSLKKHRLRFERLSGKTAITEIGVKSKIGVKP
jgi:hypothetical protein